MPKKCGFFSSIPYNDLTLFKGKNILKTNYYVGAVIYNSSGSSRILEWIYITTIVGTPSQTIFSVAVENSVNISSSFNIGQMSGITGVTGTQQLFIPSSEIASNIYNNYYVFNQSTTSPSYTVINNFDRDTHLAVAQSNVSAWAESDVLILRKELPNTYNGNYYVKNTSVIPIPVIPGYNICALGTTPPIFGNTSNINTFARYYETLGDYEINVTRVVGFVVKIVGESASETCWI